MAPRTTRGTRPDADRAARATRTGAAGDGAGRAPRAVTEGGDAYVRGPDGAWRRAADGFVVADAEDVTLDDLFEPPAATVDGGAVRLVPRSWASRHPDHPLAWIFDHAELGGRGPVAVPAQIWDERAGDVVAMASSVLHPWNLVGTDGVAAIIGVEETTVRSYLARGQMPEPLVRLGRTPVWSRDQIEAWHATRTRARAARRRSAAGPADDDHDESVGDDDAGDLERAGEDREDRPASDR